MMMMVVMVKERHRIKKRGMGWNKHEGRKREKKVV